MPTRRTSTATELDQVRAELAAVSAERDRLRGRVVMLEEVARNLLAACRAQGDAIGQFLIPNTLND